MKRERTFIGFTIIMFLASTLACGFFADGVESTDPPAITDQSGEDGSPDKPVQGQLSNELTSEEIPSAQSDSHLQPELDLGNEYRSEEGGYAFKPISGYELEEFFGLATMIAPDADQDLGPMLMLIGGFNEEEVTGEKIFNDFMEDAESEDVEILDQKEIIIDGKSGLLADIVGNVDREDVFGRIVVVAVSPTQQFTMFASAPHDRWDEIETSFEDVLASIRFFEPEKINFSEESEEAQPDDSTILDFPSLENFPTEASQLPPGGFTYLLASDQGFPTIVSHGTLQDQSTSAEYVIDLVSEDLEYRLTLFIPLDVASGIITMQNKDSSVATSAPGAAVYHGSSRFTNTDGIIIVDEVSGNIITGSVFFTAIDEVGNEIAVSGFFNKIPLPAR